MDGFSNELLAQGEANFGFNILGKFVERIERGRRHFARRFTPLIRTGPSARR